MAYIDPEGMFGGDRMALLSDEAKWMWPWLWCASNTVGRVELNYRTMIDTAFRQFRTQPTEQEFWDCVSEFHECYLMYVFKSDNGQVWGQWDVADKYLPKYKTRADNRTPAPIVADFLGWKKGYSDRKQNAISGKCRVLNILEKLENFQKISNISEGEKDFQHFARRGEERKGVKTYCPPNGVPEPEPTELFTPEPTEPEVPKVHDKWLSDAHDHWYDHCYWNKKKREDSRKAFSKRVRQLVRDTAASPEHAVEFLNTQARLDRKRFEFTDDWSWRQNLHPTTWLNGKLWEDQPRARDSPEKPGFDGPDGMDGYQELR